MNENYSGIRLSYNLSVIQNDEGVWEGKMTVVHEKTSDGENWEKAEASFSNKGSDDFNLVNDLVNTFTYYMQKIDGNLFNKPELQ